jgi:hypothetical protein
MTDDRLEALRGQAVRSRNVDMLDLVCEVYALRAASVPVIELELSGDAAEDARRAGASHSDADTVDDDATDYVDVVDVDAAADRAEAIAEITARGDRIDARDWAEEAEAQGELPGGMTTDELAAAIYANMRRGVAVPAVVIERVQTAMDVEEAEAAEIVRVTT